MLAEQNNSGKVFQTEGPMGYLPLLAVSESDTQEKNKSDGILKKLHNKTERLVLNKGQRCLLCSSNKFCRCPLLSFESVDDSDVALDDVFDLLFDKIIKYYGQTN